MLKRGDFLALFQEATISLFQARVADANSVVMDKIRAALSKSAAQPEFTLSSPTHAGYRDRERTALTVCELTLLSVAATPTKHKVARLDRQIVRERMRVESERRAKLRSRPATSASQLLRLEHSRSAGALELSSGVQSPQPGRKQVQFRPPMTAPSAGAGSAEAQIGRAHV